MTETLFALNLSQSALDATRYVMLLKVYREGNPDLAADRLEALLDSAILGIASDYSPTRDQYRSAAKALREAAAYRAAHPYRNPMEARSAEVLAALAKAQAMPQ
jgi:hypothetical protein